MAIQVLSAVAGIIVARELGPGLRGVLAAVVLWPTLVGDLSLLGVDSALTINVARSKLSQSAAKRGGLRFACLATLVAVPIAWLLIRHGLPKSLSAEARSAATLFTLLIPMYLGTSLLVAVDRGLGDFGRLNLTRLIVPPVYLLGILVCLGVMGELTVYRVVVALLLANAAALGTRAWIGRTPSGSQGSPGVGRLLGQARPFFVTEVVGKVYARLDHLIIVWVLSPAAFGLYVVAVTASSLHLTAAKALQQIVFARGAALSQKGAMRDAARIYRITGLIGLLPMVALAGLLPFFLPLLFGAAFAPAVVPALVLLGAHYLRHQGLILDEALRSQCRPLAGLRARLIAAPVFAAVVLISAPTLGATGVAVAATAGETVFLIAMIKAVRDVERQPLVPSPADLIELWAAVRSTSQSA